MNFVKVSLIMFLVMFLPQNVLSIGAIAIKNLEVSVEKKRVADEQKKAEAEAAEKADYLAGLGIEASKDNVALIDKLRAAGIEKPTAEHIKLQQMGLGHTKNDIEAVKALDKGHIALTKDNVTAATLLLKMIEAGVSLTERHLDIILSLKGNKPVQAILAKAMNEGWKGGRVGTPPNIALYIRDVSIAPAPPHARLFSIVYDVNNVHLQKYGETFEVSMNNSSPDVVGDALAVGNYILFSVIYEISPGGKSFKFKFAQKAK